MSKLYGTLSGDGRAGEQTRCANTRSKAAAQSWDGSLAVAIEYHEILNGCGVVHRFEITRGFGSTAHPSTVIAYGTIHGGELQYEYVAPEIVKYVLANHKAEQDGEVTK